MFTYNKLIFNHWAGSQLPLVNDIINIIKQYNCYRKFKLPKPFIENNLEGIVFKRLIVPNFLVHNNCGDILLKLKDKKIVEVLFFDDDIYHYYIIDFMKSHINLLKVEHTSYELIKRHNEIYASVKDPVFIAY